MSRSSKHLTELTISELLEWRDDDRVAKCERHIARCTEWIDMLGKRDTHATRFARATLKAEIARTQAILDARPSIELERAALQKAHDNWCAHIAEPLPTDTEGELRRIATRNVLDRAQVAAYRVFIAAAQNASVRTPQDPASAYAHACTESADLAAKAGDLTERFWGYGYTNAALDLAEVQGRAYRDTHGHLGLALYAIAAADRDCSDETRALFEMRWYFLCRKAGVAGAELPDLSRWERRA
jgi:hypothetical protein